MKKIKLLTVSDHPLVPSGVGTQTRYIIEGLLKTGMYEVVSFGAAIKHPDYRIQKIEDYGDDWKIIPVDGYGDENLLRNVLDIEKPDALWIMTDPRFYVWLFNMSDEIKDRGIPLLYWHVWDNYPVPDFNAGYYHSCDFVGCISKLTFDIVQKCGMVDSKYIPHAVDPEIFKPADLEEKKKIRREKLPSHTDKFIIYYNSRNARRKMTSDVIKVYSQFLDIVGKDKAFLLMHTDPHDQEGANLYSVASLFGLTPENVLFSKDRASSEDIATMYNMADVTINISNNEGFGLSCLESLSSGTPVIINKTGGLQDQAIDDEGNELGVVVEPATKTLMGSQQIPYIFDDRAADTDLVEALLKIYNMPPEKMEELGQKARDWTLKAFSLHSMVSDWESAIRKYVKKYKDNQGSPTRVKLLKV